MRSKSVVILCPDSIDMALFSKELMKQLCEELLVIAEKVEEIEVESHETTGETRSAYAIVHKDFLWKMTRKVGEVFHYLCGVKDMNPFELGDVSGNTDISGCFK